MHPRFLEPSGSAPSNGQCTCCCYLLRAAPSAGGGKSLAHHMIISRGGAVESSALAQVAWWQCVRAVQDWAPQQLLPAGAGCGSASVRKRPKRAAACVAGSRGAVGRVVVIMLVVVICPGLASCYRSTAAAAVPRAEAAAAAAATARLPLCVGASSSTSYVPTSNSRSRHSGTPPTRRRARRTTRERPAALPTPNQRGSSHQPPWCQHQPALLLRPCASRRPRREGWRPAASGARFSETAQRQTNRG